MRFGFSLPARRCYVVLATFVCAPGPSYTENNHNNSSKNPWIMAMILGSFPRTNFSHKLNRNWGAPLHKSLDAEIKFIIPKETSQAGKALHPLKNLILIEPLPFLFSFQCGRFSPAHNMHSLPWKMNNKTQLITQHSLPKMKLSETPKTRSIYRYWYMVHIITISLRCRVETKIYAQLFQNLRTSKLTSIVDETMCV